MEKTITRCDGEILNVRCSLTKLADGYLQKKNYTGEFSGNMESVWTTLIQYTGRFVEHYASDLLYSADIVRDKLNAGEIPVNQWFGLHEFGVHGNSYIYDMLDTKGRSANYRAVFLLEFEEVTDGIYAGDVRWTFSRVTYLRKREDWA